MLERQLRGVQKRTLQVSNGPYVAGDTAMHSAIQRVADNRMADGTKVDANLVGAAGVDGNLRERYRWIEMLRANNPRDRFTASARPRRHLLPVRRVATDRRVDAPARLHDPPHQRHVFLLNVAIAKLPRQLFVRAVILGNHHQARGAPIETMHNPRPLLAANAAEIRHVVKKGVDQRAARMTRGGMDDHSRGLVDDDDIAILIEDR